MAALSKVYGGTLAAFKREPRDPLAAWLVTAYVNASQAQNRELATGCYYLLCVLLGPAIGALCTRYQQDFDEALEQLLRLCREGRTDARRALGSILQARYRKEQVRLREETEFAETQPKASKPLAAPLLKSQEAKLSPAQREVVGLVKQGARIADIGPLTGTNQRTIESHWSRAKKNL
jgi:DNA-binding NarL/FixJ family response regulator